MNSIQKQTWLAVIDDNYRLSFDINKKLVYVCIDSFLFKNKMRTRVFLENQPNKHFYFEESPREVVKILSEVYIQTKNTPWGFINYLGSKTSGYLKSSKKKQIARQ